MALVRGAFAELYLRHGRLAEAEASAQKAIRVWEHLPGAAPYEIVRVLTVAGEASGSRVEDLARAAQTTFAGVSWRRCANRLDQTKSSSIACAGTSMP